VSVVSVIQHAKRMRRIILPSVACLAVPYFYTLSHKRHDFWKKLLNIKCVFWFSVQLLSETFLILRRIQRDIIINIHRSLRKVPLLLSDFNETWVFSRHSKKSSNIKFNENPSSGSRVVPCGRTDITKLIVAFRNFANAPKTLFSFKCVYPLVYSSQSLHETESLCWNFLLWAMESAKYIKSVHHFWLYG
jgi:hypothetical protein